MKCPNCGAAVNEGNFCNYCGAKLITDPKQVDIKINHRFEDVADLERVEYERQESRLRQKQALEEHKQEMMESKLRQKLMKKELRNGRGVFLNCLIGFMCLGGCATIVNDPKTGIILFIVAIILVFISKR